MSQCDSDSGLSVSIDGSHCGISSGPKIEVRIPDLNIKRSLAISMSETVGMLKKLLINTLASDLKDTMNFGLFIPPTAGKAGKFLLEERTLTEYGLHQSNQSIELRYKRRLYRTANINVTRLKRLHSKANLKTFMEYVGSGDTVRVIKMLNKGLDPNYQLKDTGESPLVRACSLSRSGEMIKVLVEGGAHLDYRHSNGHTPLHAAAILGNLEAVQIILDLGQSPNTVDLEGLTPLYHSTISNTAVACAERLLYDYSVIGVEDENGLQEIHQACRFGRVQHLELLLQYNADINSQTSKNGNTPLHICAYLNQESCARLLLFRGADRNIVNRSGHTPYQQALLSDNKPLAMLIQYYKDEDVVLVKSLAKYNDKRKGSSVAVLPIMHRSRSASGISDQCQMEIREDSGFISQPGSCVVPDHTRTRARSIGGKLPDTHANNSLKSDTSSLFSKKFSRSFSNLHQNSGNGHSVEPAETADDTDTGWTPDWDMNDNTDTVSSVSGPSQRKSVRSNRQKDCGKRTRSQSCKRRNSKGDIAGLTEIDTRFLPRMVVLQKNSQGFGFVIRGLKATTGFAFVPSPLNPALQYFEEVEPGSVAARAGILKGDYILEINNHPVVCTSHEETVRLIKASGEFLAMKVVSIKKSHSKEQHQQNYWDRDSSSMDDSSDISSIISADIRSQQPMSTFTRSIPRSSVPCSSTSNQFVPPSSSYNSMPHYKNEYNLPPSTYFIPAAPFSTTETSVNIRMHRNSTGAPTTRPDSITSIDSLYPMPPPPINDFCPRESKIDEEYIEDRTLKRNHNCKPPVNPPGSAILHDTFHEQTTAPQPPCTAPPPPAPPPPPPPPCSAPQLSAPKPILKQPKPILKPQPPATNSSLNFDNHLRDAIAKRREKIENDQCSVASFDSVDDVSKQHTRTTLSSLKHVSQYSRSQSNRWMNAPQVNEESPNRGGIFQRTHSEMYTTNNNNNNNNPGNQDRKGDEKTSRLYLV